MAEKLKFAKKAAADQAGGRPWRILIVDDDAEVHSVTKLALRGVTYKERGLEFLDAHSAAEAREMLAVQTDIALVLLDVVMETEDAGLTLVRYIRQNLDNRKARIVLRTGQPGQAPEKDVIVGYDINDYKAKTELTQEKLFTTVISALRAYEDIVAIDLNRRGLEQIIAASSSLFKLRSMQLFATGVLTQVSAVLGCGEDGIMAMCRGGRPGEPVQELDIVAAAGRFLDQTSQTAIEAIDPEVARVVAATIAARASQHGRGYSCLYLKTPDDRELAIYVKIDRALSDLERGLIEVLGTNVSIGLDNVRMYDTLAGMNRDLERLVEERTRQLRAQTKQALEATKRFQGIIELAHDGVISIASDRTITLFNPAAEQIFGWSAAEITGRSLDLLIPESGRAALFQVIDTFLAGDEASLTLPPAAAGLRRDGSEFPAEISISKLRIAGRWLLTAVIRDITERMAFEDRLRQLAISDPLTGVFNRRHFMEIAEAECDRARREHKPLTLAMIDADHFKAINDAYGHAVGDEVLRGLVMVARQALHGGDVLARYGGEEFVALFPDTPLEAALPRIEALRAAVAASPLGANVTCTVSIGVAAAGPECSLEWALAAADGALYAAKAAGRNQVTCASQSSRRSA
jgi:diguanylate cyclase (GGDEF)-like protein/PAS domain S-box-containing protein